jgi:hypothetical protein
MTHDADDALYEERIMTVETDLKETNAKIDCLDDVFKEAEDKVNDL